MFGVNKKRYIIVSTIFFVIGIVMLILCLFNVLKPHKTFNLLSILLLVIGFVLYLRPMSKRIKNFNYCVQNLRDGFYSELTKNNSLPESCEFVENEKGIVSYNNFSFDELTYNESVEVIKTLLSDFVYIIYGSLDEDKKKIEKAKIESFKVTMKRYNGEIKESYLIKDYKYLV